MPRSSTTFGPKWAAGKTKVIRVPEVLAEEVLRYARELDRRHALQQKVHEPPALYSERSPSVEVDPTRPVNVASIPLRSPFRYPGGKTWLVPYIRLWLRAMSERPILFVEPFAGGGICSLTVAFEGLADHVLMMELDQHVAAVWKTILMGQAEWLAQEILRFDMNLENVKSRLHEGETNTRLALRERAFLTILRNRVQRGGIMAPGAGLVKSGENGKGIGSRWYPETLARRIRDIGRMRHRISFIEADAMKALDDYLHDERTVIFADPPYTKAARRLYEHWEIDHALLFSKLASGRSPFLLSYDDADTIRRLAAEHGLQVRTVCMKNTHHARKKELLISRDLTWLDAAAPRQPVLFVAK